MENSEQRQTYPPLPTALPRNPVQEELAAARAEIASVPKNTNWVAEAGRPHHVSFTAWSGSNTVLCLLCHLLRVAAGRISTRLSSQLPCLRTGHVPFPLHLCVSTGPWS